VKAFPVQTISPRVQTGRLTNPVFGQGNGQNDQGGDDEFDRPSSKPYDPKDFHGGPNRFSKSFRNYPTRKLTREDVSMSDRTAAKTLSKGSEVS
jgi:hypothetical protein